jgi:hypothetical protein
MDTPALSLALEGAWLMEGLTGRPRLPWPETKDYKQLEGAR